MDHKIHNSLLMASEEATRSEIEKNFGGFELSSPENGTQSRKSKSNMAAQKKKKKKKQPQRGMGVEQLERLRLQETWKKMTETEIENNHHYFLPASFPDPMPPRVQAPFEKFGGYGVLNNGAAGVLVGLNQSLSLQTLGNGGFCGQIMGGSGVGGLFPDQFHGDPYGVGVLNLGLRAGNVGGETSKELSSIPNTNCYPCHGGLCHKKKRVNGENFGCNGKVTDKYAGLSSINGGSFLGFDLPNKQNVNGEDHDFGMGLRAPCHAGYAGCNVDQGVEITAVHRKGSSSRGGVGGGVLMEYEFFPGKGGGRGTSSSTSSFSSSSKELDFFGFSPETSVPVCGGEGSCVTTTTRTTSTGFDASISIDLSLKLSY